MRVGGWVVEKVEKTEAVQMSYCQLGFGWVDERTDGKGDDSRDDEDEEGGVVEGGEEDGEPGFGVGLGEVVGPEELLAFGDLGGWVGGLEGGGWNEVL